MGGLKVLMTPGFEAAAQEAGLGSGWMAAVIAQLNTDGEPSWIVGDPDAVTTTLEDEGRTRRVPAPLRCWVIRDDHDPACDCGCDGRRVVTCMLPSEY